VGWVLSWGWGWGAQVCNVVVWLRVSRGAPLVPALGAGEREECEALEAGLASLKAQLQGQSCQQPRETPRQLEERRAWPVGGLLAVRQAAVTATRATLALAPAMRQLAGASAPVITFAVTLNRLVLLLFLTALPPQRPASLASLTLRGACGVPPVPRPAGQAGCVRCLGFGFGFGVRVRVRG
jgi:hypothetical protein